jgi:hypothetical protein
MWIIYEAMERTVSRKIHKNMIDWLKVFKLTNNRIYYNTNGIYIISMSGTIWCFDISWND